MFKGKKKKRKKEKELTNEKGIILNEKYIGWHGSTPFVEFDENFVQMPLTRTELKIPREHTTRMTYLAWWSGFVAGARGQVNLKTFLIIILIIGLITAGLTFYLNSGNQAGFEALNNRTDAINNRISNIENVIKINQTAPVV